MKKFLIIAAFMGFLLAQTTQMAQARGLFYTNTEYPVSATGVSVKDLKNMKKGESSSLNILGVVEYGDAGIQTAAVSKGIKKIYFVDMHEKAIFIFYRKLTTKVYGE